MAVTKTPRKKSDTGDTTKAAKAPAKKATGKVVAEKPVRKAPAKKADLEATAEPKPVRKARTEPVPPPAVEPAPKASPKKKSSPAEPSAPEPAVPASAQAILAAIREGRALEFIFSDAEANAPRTFEPRQLTFDALSQAWYVWGWDRRYNAERFHRLDLLAEVNPVEGVGRAAQGPYADGTPANQIGGWLGGEPIPVKISLMKQWVFAVKQAPPAFPHFHLEEQGDGQAVVTFSATDLRAIARWVFQFGDGVQVLEPARLLDRMRQVASVWTGRDRQPATAPAPRPEPPRPASRPEAQEPRRQEARPPRESRPREAEEDAPKGKPGKVEVIRFDRL